MRSIVTLSTVAVLLWLPATSSARDATGRAQTEQGASHRTALRTAGLLGFGAGYRSERGSPAVRGLQVRLRTLGFRPGPVDGLFGPLTEAAVERFQRAHGLDADGVVGPRTRRPLLRRPPGGSGRDRAGPERPTPVEARPPPLPDTGGAPEPLPMPVPDAGGAPPQSTPWLAAGLGALGTALLLGGLWVLGSRRRGRTPGSRVRLGMACAALLAVLALGAVAGALFATQATPDRGTKEAAITGAVLEPGQRGTP
jgi:peptidoglycan hydrolase-like protein with peptidoglycan-binding domain